MSTAIYVVRFGSQLAHETRLSQFENVLLLAEALSSAEIAWDVVNVDNYSFASDTGVSDGLTADEREALSVYR